MKHDLDHSDLLDYSTVIDRTERMKKRWLRVIENKEKMVMDSQRVLKAKFDKLAKSEKKKKKKNEDKEEDHQIMIERRKEKFSIILKRRQN